MPLSQHQSIQHYENFPVASFLCPRHLRRAVTAVYHFARTADDLADEGEASAKERLKLLKAYRAGLEKSLENGSFESDPSVDAISSSKLNSKALHSSQAQTIGEDSSGNDSAHSLSDTAHAEQSYLWQHVFSPLGEAIKKFSIPHQHFHDLLDAFEQDVTYTDQSIRYENNEQLINYCMKSAAPIGRIMMHLFGQSDPRLLSLSDKICCALQLINFCQDINQDIARRRLYIPINSSLEQLIAESRELMMKGAPLALEVPGRAGWELRAVVQGGLRIVDRIELVDPRIARPKLGTFDCAVIAWRCLFKSSFRS